MFCPNCGQRLEQPNDAFCPNCGTAVRRSSGAGATSGPAAGPPPPPYPPYTPAGSAGAFGAPSAGAPASQPWPSGYGSPLAPGTPAFGMPPGMSPATPAGTPGIPSAAPPGAPATPVGTPGAPGPAATPWATPMSAPPPAGYAPPYAPPDAGTTPPAGAPNAWSGAPPPAPAAGGSGTPPWIVPPTGGTPPGPSGDTPRSRGRFSVIVGVILAVVLLGCLCTCGLVLLTRAHRQCTGNCGASAITPSASAAVSAPAGPAVLYQNPLTAAAPGWPVAPPNCQFAAGGYEVASRICDAPDPSFGDGGISVTLRQLSGPLSTPLSIIFRRTARVGGRGDYYAFSIDASGRWGFSKSVNGHVTSITPISAAAAINSGAGATNTLRVRATGSHFVFFVNGVQVGQADDSALVAGRIGLGAGMGGQAIFNDFAVTTS